MRGTEPVLRIEQTFPASRERVFAAWTHPEVLRRWWAAGPGWASPWIEVDLRVGGSYRLAMTAPGAADTNVVAGQYLEIAPPRRLVYTWQWESAEAPGGDAVTLVTVEFRDAGAAGTTVVLTHSGFPDADARDQHDAGWRACLAQLDERVLRAPVAP
ncbi:MAG: SRPBCC domain-containing protein [Pseudonocardia sp.]|nr:SRPBCC domain-containing protein [Pseudonocardia sp.]